MLKGEASLDDLVASDEDNFSAFDEKMAEILSDDQKAEYAAVQEEREIQRVEKKATEDLDGLEEAAVGLTEEQKDQAWDIFVRLNAEDKPGRIPEGTTMDDFSGYIDGEIGKRLEQDVRSGRQSVRFHEGINGLNLSQSLLLAGRLAGVWQSS